MRGSQLHVAGGCLWFSWIWHWLLTDHWKLYKPRKSCMLLETFTELESMRQHPAIGDALGASQEGAALSTPVWHAALCRLTDALLSSCRLMNILPS